MMCILFSRTPVARAHGTPVERTKSDVRLCRLVYHTTEMLGLIRKRLENAEVIPVELQSQFRCNGSDGYLAWPDADVNWQDKTSRNVKEWISRFICLQPTVWRS